MEKIKHNLIRDVLQLIEYKADTKNDIYIYIYIYIGYLFVATTQNCNIYKENLLGYWFHPFFFFLFWLACNYW